MRNKYLALLFGALFCVAPMFGATAKKKSKATPSTSGHKAAPARGKHVAATPVRHRTTQRTQGAPTPERIKEIQQALATRGFYTGEITGQWGPESVEALKKFQQDQNLQVDGKLGALSLIALGLGPKRQSSNEAVVTMPQKTNQ